MLSADAKCSDILKLYYIEATNSSMAGARTFFNKLLDRFSSGQCINNKTDDWLWKFLPSMYKNDIFDPLCRFSSILIDNSITWKEELIWGIELSFSFGFLRTRNLDSSKLYSSYQIGINPYRFDKMGFDDKTFNLSHLHQCIQYLLIGLILSWILFLQENFYFMIFEKHLPFKSIIRRKM